MLTQPHRWLAHLLGLLAGVLYGICLQALLRHHAFSELEGIMTLGIVFLLPMVIGFLTVFVASSAARRGLLYALFFPWTSVATCLAFSFAIGWEGAICIALAAPVYLVMASFGGLIAWLVLRRRGQGPGSAMLAGAMLALPLGACMLESEIERTQRYERADTFIDIGAEKEAVWREIIRVPPLDERVDGLVYALGFPKPIEATLSHEGVGGVRAARFERGLEFLETIQVWEPNERLAFQIAVEPGSVPPTALDAHVTLGGPYFDVLEGTYRIEPRAGGVRLHLSSRFRLGTHFNFYAGPWARWVMSDIQNSILTVLKSRAERDRRTSRYP